MNATQPSNNNALDPWIFWLAFRKHWGWCVPAGLLLASLASLGVYSTFEKEYEAFHLLEVNRDFQLFPTTHGIGRDLAKSEKQLILKGQILDPLLADPSLNGAPSLSNPASAERELISRLGISNGGTDNYLLITYRDKDPVAAAKVCNAIVDSYLQKRENSAERRSQQVMEWLTPSINQWKADVIAKRARISALSKEAYGYDPYKPGTTLEQSGVSLQMLNQNKGALVAEIALIEAKKQALSASEITKPVSPDPRELEKFVREDADILKIQAKIDERQAKMRELELRDEHDGLHRTFYNRLKVEAEDFERELSAMKESVRTKGVETLNRLEHERAVIAKQQQLREYDNQLSDLQAKLVRVEADYNSEKERIQKLAGETADLYFAKQEYEQTAEILKHLDEKMAMIKTEQQKNSAIQSVAPAKAPAYAIEEMPFKKMAAASGAGLVFPFALAVLLEFFVKRIVDARRLEMTVKAPVLGEISRYNGGGLNDYSRRMFTESIDALRANLSFKLSGVRSIVVTSAMPAEGKSSVASQLAISLAKAFEEPVLLVDADVRLPGLHSMFNIGFGPGLTNVLRGQVNAVEAINTSPGELVHVLTAGKLTGSPHALMSKKNLETFLNSVPEKYRYIIIDTAPVLPAAETLSLAATADATILCAMRDVSRTDHLSRAQRQLEAAGANILGTVFSGVPSREYAYRYGDYRYAYKG